MNGPALKALSGLYIQLEVNLSDKQGYWKVMLYGSMGLTVEFYVQPTLMQGVDGGEFGICTLQLPDLSSAATQLN